MSKKLIYPIISIAIGALIAGFAFYSWFSHFNTALSSSVEGQEAAYSTLITSADASATAVTELKYGTTTAVLGSIIVGSTSPSIADQPLLRVYSQASTTPTSTDYLIAEIYEDTVGNIDYDLRVNQGLVLEVFPGFDGSYTVTWK